MELFQPILAIREQEVNYVVFTIVKAKRVPSGMLVSIAWVEELVGISSQVAQSLHFILHGMRMNDVHNHGNAVLMSGINQRFQFLGCSEARGSGEERTHMVAKRTIIRMFLNGHDLYAIVSVLDDTWKHVVPELHVCAHLLGILSHTDVAFINQERRSICLEFLLFPFVWCWVPNLSGEYLGGVVLHYASCPSRDTLTVATFPIYVHLEEVTVLDGFLREFQFPVARTFNAFSLISVRFCPIVEIAHQVNGCCVGCPLTENPSARSLVQAKILMSIGKVAQCLLSVLCQLS